jgi:cell shape-determining protein MreC
MNDIQELLADLLGTDDWVEDRARRLSNLTKEYEAKKLTKEEYLELVEDLAKIDSAMAETTELKRIIAFNKVIAVIRAVASVV